MAYIDTYSIFPTDKFGTLRRTSGGLVVLRLAEVVLVEPPARLEVAFDEAPALPVAPGVNVEDAVCAAERDRM